MGILVVPHDPKWCNKFEAEAKILRSCLGAVAMDIHHIGSTSIPQIFAKPIVDILIEASSLNAVDEKTPLLEALGYEALGEFGINARRYFRKDNPAGLRQFQIHVFNADSHDATRHLAFRDYLRSHSMEAGQYSDLKRKLAEQHGSGVEAYMSGKDPFIKATELTALAWWRLSQ